YEMTGVGVTPSSAWMTTAMPLAASTSTAVRWAGPETAWVSLPTNSGPVMPLPARYSTRAWVMARMWASVKVPSLDVARGPLGPKLTSWLGSLTFGLLWK